MTSHWTVAALPGPVRGTKILCSSSLRSKFESEAYCWEKRQAWWCLKIVDKLFKLHKYSARPSSYGVEAEMRAELRKLAENQLLSRGRLR
ncbi:hypothetical protein BDZ89DRAFT_1075844 [Hymenopellis radicata]|nr:hypothetical protein BDZ89DRAFT_1075844 [Hymenopellis radicata]